MKDENLYVVEHLEGLLSANNLESDFQVIYSQAGGEYIIEIQEIKKSGTKFLVFDSSEPLPGEIEEQYENDKINYFEMVMLVIIHNLFAHLELLHLLIKVSKDEEE